MTGLLRCCASALKKLKRKAKEKGEKEEAMEEVGFAFVWWI
jgi:hypothetical protein